MSDSNVSDGASSADEPLDAVDDRLCAGVVTVSTDRSLESDAAGEAIETALRDADHEIATREHVVADHDRVQSIVTRVIDRDDVDVVITAGGTSVEPSDVTIEAVEPLLEKDLPAFGELFTTLAYEAVGTRVVASRTLAGVSDGTLVCCLPGNDGAARLATEKILLAEGRYLVDLARGHGTAGDPEGDGPE